MQLFGQWLLVQYKCMYSLWSLIAMSTSVHIPPINIISCPKGSCTAAYTLNWKKGRWRVVRVYIRC